MSNQKNTGKLKKVGFILLAVAIAAIIIGLNVWNFVKDSGFSERRTVAIETENFSVSEAQMYYYFYSQYQSTYNSLAGYGLDPSVYGLTAGQSLKNQKCTFDSTKTWFQYFMETAMTNVQEQLALCEAAKAEGLELTDADNEEIENMLESIEKNAKTQGYTLKNYLKANYGKVVSVSDVEKSLELEMLATKYLEKKLDKVDVSYDALKAIYDKDTDKYDTVDYATFTFDFNDIYDVLIKDKNADDTTEDEDAKADDESEDKDEELDPEVKTEAVKIAKEYSEKLSKVTDIKSFEEVLKDFYVNVMKQSEETAKKTLADAKHVVEGAYYKEGDEQLAWLFGKDDAADVKVGAVKTFTETEEHDHEEGDDHTDLAEIYTVILVTRTRGTVEGVTSVDVRHILFSTDTYKDDSEVNKIYEQWKKDGAKEDDFAKLAEKYTEDDGSKFNGGLYEGVTEGQMVDEFNDWIFDKERKAGDHGIVKTSYGWHMMYYVEGLEEWASTIKAELQSEASEEAVEAASDKYEAKINYDAVNSVDA